MTLLVLIKPVPMMELVPHVLITVKPVMNTIHVFLVPNKPIDLVHQNVYVKMDIGMKKVTKIVNHV